MKDQRKFHGLRAHVDQLLSEGWYIASRRPLTLKRGSEQLRFRLGMLLDAA